MGNKLSKSFIAAKGIVYGAEQFIELGRTFMEKTGCIEAILDENGEPTGAYKVLHSFKTVMEIDVDNIRGEVPAQIEAYQKYKRNTDVRTIKTQVKSSDPGDNENVTPPIVEDDDTPAVGVPLEVETQSVFPAGNKAASRRESLSGGTKKKK